MTVRELIENLLDCDMDVQVEVECKLNDTTIWETFEIEEAAISREIHLSVDLLDRVLIKSDRLEELEGAEEKLQELEGSHNG